MAMLLQVIANNSIVLYSHALKQCSIACQAGQHVCDVGVSRTELKYCLQEAIQNLGEQLWSPEWQARHNAYLKGRMQNTQQYKPGSQELLLLFSDRDGKSMYQFPLYEQLRDVLEPILLQVILTRYALP